MSILTVMVVMLSISQNTICNNDIALAPISNKGEIPKPLSCLAAAKKIPSCVELVKPFTSKI